MLAVESRSSIRNTAGIVTLYLFGTGRKQQPGAWLAHRIGGVTSPIPVLPVEPKKDSWYLDTVIGLP
jgi:hypothetical protein